MDEMERLVGLAAHSDNGRTERQENVVRILQAGVLYFVLVFGTGFVLGAVRTIWIVPRVGARTAELVEMPIMLAASIVAARWTILRLSVPWRGTHQI